MTSQAHVRRRTTLPAAALSPSVSCRCPSIASYMCWTCCAARPSLLSPPGRGGRRRIAPMTWRSSRRRKGRMKLRPSARRSLPPRLRRRSAAATTFACPPICTALHRAMLPTWSTRAARAVPTRRLPNMRRRSYRACCPVARQSISLPTRWGSSVVWRCPFCATIPTLPRPPCSIPWHPSRALLWRSASTMGS